jgi:nucleoside-diphosphate-sugar epimerase
VRVLVFGGTRFMGPHVVRELAARGHDVTLFHRGEHEAFPELRHVHAERTKIPRGLDADLVIDMWCMREAHALAAKERFGGARYVVLSSGDVYRNYDGLQRHYGGAPDPVPLAEDAPLREELYPYRHKAAQLGDWVRDYDKLLVERALAGPRTTVLRMPAVYGPDDEHRRFYDWIDAMLRGDEVIAIDGAMAGWRWTRGWAANCADAIVHAAFDERAAGRTYNVGEPDTPCEEEWLRLIADIAKWDGRIERRAGIAPPLDFRFHLHTDTRRIREELGWRERVSRAEALASLTEWRRAGARS